MEGTGKELLKKEFQETSYPAEKLSFSVAKNRKEDMTEVEIVDKKKSAESLSREEEILKARLIELKKENFSLQASINAWQLTLKNKLDEFKEADLKLRNMRRVKEKAGSENAFFLSIQRWAQNEIYNEIWSERESFCSKTDTFNDEYGILSEWWEKQMKFVSDLEKLEKERLEDRKCQQEIDELEKQVDELKRKAEAGKQEIEVKVHSTQDEDCFRKDESEAEVSPEKLDTQKVESLLTDDQIEICGAETNNTQNELFSMLDLEKVRMANRIKHRRCKNHFFTRVKKLGE